MFVIFYRNVFESLIVITETINGREAVKEFKNESDAEGYATLHLCNLSSGYLITKVEI